MNGGVLIMKKYLKEILILLIQLIQIIQVLLTPYAMDIVFIAPIAVFVNLKIVHRKPH